jgi:hypothetical protein
MVMPTAEEEVSEDARISIVDDQLILYKSSCVHNMRTPASQEYFTILYFLQSKPNTS